jgi:HAD domain family 1 in Swiss Army Knife RNA repair proteins
MSMTLITPVRPLAASYHSWLICQVFSSPLPNPQLWHSQTVGFLQNYECFVHGGWWHDPSILSATGEGIEKEEARGWKDCWNEEIVRRRNLTRDEG